MKKALLRSKTGTVYDVVLDEHKYYFRGDRVLGRLIVIPSKPLRITGIRLEFFGRIKTYINSKKQDGHYFFKELFPLDVQTSTLQEGKTYTFPFDFNLPVDVSLPSCTESDTNAGGMIEYVIKASMERPSREWSALTALVHIPVLERLDVSKTELLEPVWDKVSWQSQHPEDIIDADEYQGVDQVNLSASIPHKGYTRDQKIPVTIDIQHFQPYQKVNGLTISLIRCTRVLCKEKAYLLSPTIVSSTKVDIDIQDTTTQTITQSILIPRHISPTINLNARLMQVDYRIEVRAELDEPDRNNGNGGTIASFMTMATEKQYMDVDLASMRLELPVVIGTLPSLSPPPDILDPKFIKGVKHIGQENKTNQQQQQERQPSRFSSSFSALASLDLASIPAGLLEITSTNLRWDPSSSRRQSNTARQQQSQQQQRSSSKDETPISPTKPSPLTTTMISSRSSSKMPTTPTTSSAPTMSIPTYRSGLDESTTMTSSPSSSIPVHRSDLSETITTMTTTSPTSATPSPSSPFYLTLSLGEPFDLLQSGFTDNDRYSLQSTRISASSKSSHASSNGTEKDKPISTTEPFTSVAKNYSAERFLNGSSTSSSSLRSSVGPNNNAITSTAAATTTTTGPSLLATINHSSDYLSSDTSSSLPTSPRSSLGANSSGLIVTSQPVIDTATIQHATLPSSPSTTGHTDSPDNISDAELSPCNTPKGNTDSQRKLAGGTTIQSGDTNDTVETNTLTAKVHSTTLPSITTTPVTEMKNSADDYNHGYEMDEQKEDTRRDDTKKLDTTTTITHEKYSGSGSGDDGGSGFDQTKESGNAGQLDSNHNGLFPASAATGVYRQVSTYSNYRQTNSELLDKQQGGHEEEEEESAYKPESTIEGLEISAVTIESAPPASLHQAAATRDHKTTTTTGNGILLHAHSVDDDGDSNGDLFDKPHEMAYSDSDDDSDDDDDDDFLSILARREKQAENSYWQ